MLEDLFGGVVFLAPLDVPENTILSSASKRTGRKFLRFDILQIEFPYWQKLSYVWSKGAKEYMKAMNYDNGSTPMLDRSPIFQYVLDSRQVYMPDLKVN